MKTFGLWSTLRGCGMVVVLYTLIWAIVSNAQTVDQRIHIDDPRFIKNPPAHILEKFTLDEDGYIIDGPRQADGEPIDYTSLISDDLILSIFRGSLFGCEEYLKTSCTIELTKWSKPIINIHIILDENISSVMESKLTSLFLTKFKNTLRYTQIDAQITNNPESANVVILIGSIDYWQKINKIFFNNDIANHIQFLSSLEYEVLSKRFFKYFSRYPTNCHYQSYLDYHADLRKVVVYATLQDSSLCATKMVFLSMGFMANKYSLSSVLIFNDQYQVMTKLDKIMLDILYDDRLKSGMLFDEAMPIAKQILTELRPEVFYNND